MFKRLQELWAKKMELEPEMQQELSSLVTESNAIQALNEMKATGGWKILETKIKEELQKRILEKIKDDEKIKTLLSVLSTVETKEQEKLLEEQINQIIPQ